MKVNWPHSSTLNPPLRSIQSPHHLRWELSIFKKLGRCCQWTYGNYLNLNSQYLQEHNKKKYFVIRSARKEQFFLRLTCKLHQPETGHRDSQGSHTQRGSNPLVHSLSHPPMSSRDRNSYMNQMCQPLYILSPLQNGGLA